MFAVVVDFNSVAKQQQKQFEPGTCTLNFFALPDSGSKLFTRLGGGGDMPLKWSGVLVISLSGINQSFRFH